MYSSALNTANRAAYPLFASAQPKNIHFGHADAAPASASPTVLVIGKKDFAYWDNDFFKNIELSHPDKTFVIETPSEQASKITQALEKDNNFKTLSTVTVPETDGNDAIKGKSFVIIESEQDKSAIESAISAATA